METGMWTQICETSCLHEHKVTTVCGLPSVILKASLLSLTFGGFFPTYGQLFFFATSFRISSGKLTIAGCGKWTFESSFFGKNTLVLDVFFFGCFFWTACTMESLHHHISPPFGRIFWNLFQALNMQIQGNQQRVYFRYHININFRKVTWRIIPVSKWLVTPIYKPLRPCGRGPTTPVTPHGYYPFVIWIIVTVWVKSHTPSVLSTRPKRFLTDSAPASLFMVLLQSSLNWLLGTVGSTQAPSAILANADSWLCNFNPQHLKHAWTTSFCSLGSHFRAPIHQVCCIQIPIWRTDAWHPHRYNILLWQWAMLALRLNLNNRSYQQASPLWGIADGKRACHGCMNS